MRTGGFDVIRPFALVISMVVTLSAASLVWADFTFRPGFGTKEGVLGPNYQPPTRQQTHTPPTTSQPRQTQQQPRDQERIRMERRAAERREEQRQEVATSIGRESTEILLVGIETGLVDVQLSAGTALFGLGGDPGYGLKRGTGFTPATQVSTENLRRAVSIIQPLAGTGTGGTRLSDEDARFLADQAGLAMVAAPLQITVPASSSANRISGSQLNQARVHLAAIQEGLEQLSSQVAARLELEKKLTLFEVRLEKDNYSDGQAKAADRVNLSKLKTKYETDRKQEQVTRQALKNLKEQFRKSVGIEIAR